MERRYNNNINVIKYLKTNGNKPVSDFPLCFADNIVFALLCYLNLEESQYKDLKSYKLKDIKLDKCPNFNKHYFMHNEFKYFIRTLLKCERYKDLLITNVFAIRQKDPVCYQGNMTFILNDDVFVCFRGTQQETEAWDEDLKSIVLPDLPSEAICTDYLKRAIDEFDGKKIHIIGHSKGGYLSFVTYSNLNDEYKEKVFNVVSFDGEGSPNPNKIKRDGKMVKYVPSLDLVGMFFEETIDYEVIKSSRKNIETHCLFSWVLDETTNFCEPVYKEKVLFPSDFIRFFCIEFFKTSSYEDNMRWTEYIMEIAYLNQSGSLLSIFSDILHDPRKYLKAIIKSDKEDKRELVRIFLTFIKLQAVTVRRMPENFKKLYKK